MSFMKNDKGKPKFSLVPQRALLEVAKVMTDGAEKYKRDGWRECDDISRYVDALERHVNSWLLGETFDLESTRHALAHAAANALILLELDLMEVEKIEKDMVRNIVREHLPKQDFVDHQEICRECSGVGMLFDGLDSLSCRYCEGSGRILGRQHDA